FLPRHALVHGKYLHLTGFSIETHDGQISYDPPHPPLGQTCAIARAVALDPTGRRDEIHVPHEASLLVLHGDDHVRERGDVVTPAGARQADGGIVGFANKRRVEVAEAVDLCSAHEADVDIAALQEHEHIGDRQHHVGAAGAAAALCR